MSSASLESPSDSTRSRGKGKDPLDTPTYLDGALSRNELVKRLKEVWESLKHRSQDERPKGLEGITKALINSRILDNTDKDIRLYTACSLAEVLRIYAPEAPFSSLILLRTFGLITAQLRGLASITGKQAETQGLRHPTLFLLHSLATVKSCIIMSEIVQQGLSGAEDELVDLFDCMLKSVREDHTAEIREQLSDVLTACINELEVVPQSILDTILLCLLPESKQDNLACYHLAHDFVTRTFAVLQQYITAFVNQVLIGNSSVGSDLEDHVYSLIFELHKIDAGIMLYIFPNVASNLNADDTETRARAVSLLGRLFASTRAEYGLEYPRIFREFLSRFGDMETSIRTQAVSIGGAIMERKPKLADQLAPLMQGRLRDADGEIRLKTVKEVCRVGLRCIEVVTEELLREVGERMKDRKPATRVEAVTGLASIYAKYISRWWSKEGDEDVPRDLESKLGWIPGQILLAYSVVDLRLNVLESFDEVLLPKGVENNIRTKGLLFIWGKLEKDPQGAFRKILKDRATNQQLIKTYLEARSAWRADMDNEILEINLHNAIEAIKSAMPSPDRKSSALFEKLNETKDQSATWALQQLADPRQPISGMFRARDELAAKMGTKSSFGAYIKAISRRASCFFSNHEIFMDLIYKAKMQLEDMEEENQVEDLISLLEVIIEYFPTLPQKCLPDLLELCWAASKENKIQVRMLRIIARAKLDFRAQQKEGRSGASKREDGILRKFRMDVLKVCTKDGSAKASRLAISALCELNPDPKDSCYSQLLKELTTSRSLALDNPRLEAVLRVLAVIAERFPKVFDPYADDVRSFALHKILRRKRGAGESEATLPHLGRGRGKKSKAEELSEECRRAGAAIKLLVAHRVGLKGEDTLKEDSIILHRKSAVRGSTNSSAWDIDIHDEDEDGSQNGGDQDHESKKVSLKVEVSKEELEASAGEVLDLLYEVLDAEGQTPNEANLLKHDRARLRLVCAAGVLKLMRNQRVQHRLMTTNRWRNLAWIMLDADAKVAIAFTKKLTKAVVAFQVHLKFLAMLCLAAVVESGDEEEDLSNKAKHAAAQAIVNLRKGYEDYMAGQEEEPSEDEKRMITTSMMPEYVLPYMLSLLAHYPDFPTSNQDRARWKPIQRCITFLLDSLIETLGTEADNLSFLMLMTDTILTGYRDSNDSEASSRRLHQVTQVCRSLLRARIKTQENLQSYPGKIYLPVQLYIEDKKSQRQHGSKVEKEVREMEVEGGAGPDWGSPIARPPFTVQASPIETDEKKRKRAKPNKGQRRGGQAGKKEEDSESEDEEEEEEVQASREKKKTTKTKAAKRTKYDSGSDDEEEEGEDVKPEWKPTVAEQQAARAERAKNRERMSPSAEVTLKDMKANQKEGGEKARVPLSQESHDTTGSFFTAAESVASNKMIVGGGQEDSSSTRKGERTKGDKQTDSQQASKKVEDEKEEDDEDEYEKEEEDDVDLLSTRRKKMRVVG